MIKSDEKIYSLKHIETPRLIIRPVQLGDEIFLYESILNSLELLRKSQAWAKEPSLNSTKEFVQRGVFSWASRIVSDFPMVMVHKKDQKIIGAVGYNDRCNLCEGLYEVGYWCDIDYQGHGIVTESANALTRYALEALHAKTIIISMQTENEKSIAVAKRLYFNKVGIKDRDPMDCVSEKAEKNYIYAVTNIATLPPLEVFWVHADNNKIDSEIISWAKEILKITDDKAFSGSKIILKTPWSSVMAIQTGSEFVYLKHTPALIALESKIIQLLHDQFHAPVPTVIAHNPELHCFLMKDAGTSLRSILKKKFDADLLCKAIEQFTALQITVADHVDDFIDIGVPDWRLNKLPELYQQAISQRDLFIADGLSELEVNELEKLHPKITDLCEKLADYAIKQTIIQPDFNDNNTLISDNSQNITIIDLGEISISHPFFSLLNCLYQVRKHYALTECDHDYLKIKHACLKNYMKFESEKNVADALEIANVLWFVYGLLAHDRLIHACGQEQLLSFQRGKLSEMLKELIAVCNAY